MLWNMASWILACSYPFVTAVALVVAWRFGKKGVLWVLGVGLAVALAHFFATGIALLPMSWALISGTAWVCGSFRFPAVGVAIPLAFGLLIFLNVSVGQWRQYQKPIDPVTLNRCPIASQQMWHYAERETRELQWPLQGADLAPHGEGPAQESVDLRGTKVPSLGSDLSSIAVESSDPEPAEFALTEAATAELEKAHRETVWGFVEASGFGFRRMTPSMQWPDVELPLMCNVAELPSDDSPSTADPSGSAASDFNSEFDPTRQEPTIERTVRWVAERVQLVGLLKGASPRVYELQGVPKMGQLETIPTRPLDAMEQDGLSKLRQGERLIVSVRHEEIRMLGELRATKSCLACHAVKEGALLGAFSYRLIPASPSKRANRSAGH